MAGKGGRTSGTWKKGQNPVKKKGTRHKRTVLKESIGLSNWAKLKSFIENEGAEKLVSEMQGLSGKEFINAYSSLAEYVKPKLQRTTLAGDPDNPIASKLDVTKLPTDVLEALLNALDMNGDDEEEENE